MMTPPTPDDVSTGLGLVRESQQHDFPTLASPSHPVRQRLDRIPAASPDLLAVIQAEGRV